MSCRNAGPRVGRGVALLCALTVFAVPARADPGFQLGVSVGLGQFAAGAGSARFTIVPTGSVVLHRGERWLLRADDAVTLIGAAGGGFGIANTTTLSFGARWEAINVGGGFSLAAYSVPLCGTGWCGQARGVSPGVDARFDAFYPGLLQGALGLSATCGTLWIVGDLPWNGFSTQCAIGPILRFPSR